MRVTVSSYLFDEEPIYYQPLDNIEVCEIDNSLDANQIVVSVAEGKFLITLVRNGPSTVTPYSTENKTEST